MGKALTTESEVPISTRGREIISVGFTARETGVAELCCTIDRFPALVLDSIKLPKLSQAGSLKAQFIKTPRD